MSEKAQFNSQLVLTQLEFYYSKMVKEIEDHSNEDIRKLAKTGFKLLDNGGFIVNRIP